MTIKYYTQSQIDQQAGIIGQRLRGLTVDLTEYIDASVMSTEERQKLASLESSKFLGTFLTSDDIPLDKAVAGSYADVDAGPGETVSRWIYDADNGAFVKATGEVAGETSVSVKEKYESNPDTNAFTDNHKTTLEALQGLAPATSIESFLEAFNLAMETVASSQATSFTILNSEADFGSEGFHGEYQVNDEEWKMVTVQPNVDVSQSYAMLQFVEEIVQGAAETFTYTDWEGEVITKSLTESPLVSVGGSSFLSKTYENEEYFEFPITFHIDNRENTFTGMSADYSKVDQVRATTTTTLRFRPSVGLGVDIVQEKFGGPQTVIATAKVTLMGE